MILVRVVQGKSTNTVTGKKLDVILSLPKGVIPSEGRNLIHN
jgi:hypothetical protein